MSIDKFGATSTAYGIKPASAFTRASATPWSSEESVGFLKELAGQFDTRSMSAPDMADLSSKIPVENPGHIQLKLTLLEYGASGSGSHSGARVAAGNSGSGSDRVDLIATLEEAIANANETGEPYDHLRDSLGLLRQLDAYRSNID